MTEQRTPGHCFQKKALAAILAPGPAKQTLYHQAGHPPGRDKTTSDEQYSPVHKQAVTGGPDLGKPAENDNEQRSGLVSQEQRDTPVNNPGPQFTSGWCLVTLTIRPGERS